MKMREMRKAKISWVKRETKRTRKLPSKATMTSTMRMSQKPIQTRPTRYSSSLDVQNCRCHADRRTGRRQQEGRPQGWGRALGSGAGRALAEVLGLGGSCVCPMVPGNVPQPCSCPTLTVKKASSKTSRGPEKPMTSRGWAPSRQKITPCSDVEMISSDTPIRFCVFSPAGRTGSGTPGATGPLSPESRLMAAPTRCCTQHPPRQCPRAMPPAPPGRAVPPALTQQPPEGDGRRERSEVDEDDGRNALGVQRVPEVTQVLGVPSPHVPDQPPKGPARAPQGVVLLLTLALHHLQLQQRWAPQTDRRTDGE